MLDLSGRTLGDDLTLSLSVEFMPRVQLSTMVGLMRPVLCAYRHPFFDSGQEERGKCQLLGLWVGSVPPGTIPCGHVYKLYLYWNQFSLPVLGAPSIMEGSKA